MEIRTHGSLLAEIPDWGRTEVDHAGSVLLVEVRRKVPGSPRTASPAPGQPSPV
jgi:hypothetical protein